MDKKALLIIPPERFNEDELFKPEAELKSAGIAVTIASTTTGEIIGDSQGTAVSEFVFSETTPTDYDLIAVIGGSGTNDHLWNNTALQNYLKQAYNEDVKLAGICAGAVAVAETGLLEGREATCYPLNVQTDRLQTLNVNYVETHVVAHKDIITGDGPQGAQLFGTALVEALR